MVENLAVEDFRMYAALARVLFEERMDTNGFLSRVPPADRGNRFLHTSVPDIEERVATVVNGGMPELIAGERHHKSTKGKTDLMEGLNGNPVYQILRIIGYSLTALLRFDIPALQDIAATRTQHKEIPRFLHDLLAYGNGKGPSTEEVQQFTQIPTLLMEGNLFEAYLRCGIWSKRGDTLFGAAVGATRTGSSKFFYDGQRRYFALFPGNITSTTIKAVERDVDTDTGIVVDYPPTAVVIKKGGIHNVWEYATFLTERTTPKTSVDKAKDYLLEYYGFLDAAARDGNILAVLEAAQSMDRKPLKYTKTVCKAALGTDYSELKIQAFAAFAEKIEEKGVTSLYAKAAQLDSFNAGLIADRASRWKTKTRVWMYDKGTTAYAEKENPEDHKGYIAQIKASITLETTPNKQVPYRLEALGYAEAAADDWDVPALYQAAVLVSQREQKPWDFATQIFNNRHGTTYTAQSLQNFHRTHTVLGGVNGDVALANAAAAFAPRDAKRIMEKMNMWYGPKLQAVPAAPDQTELPVSSLS